MSISACMIVKNEEANLPMSLASLKVHVDEIIVIDTGSTDRSKEIANSFGAKVHDFVWCDDFSKAKNEALKYATQEWILSIDADEVIADKDFDRIKSLIKNPEADAYFLHQRNYQNDTKLYGWQPCDGYAECRGNGFVNNPLIRLFRNHKGICFENAVHEIVDNSIERIGATVKRTNIPIHHYGYLKTEKELDEKRKKYLALGLAQVAKNPKDPRPHYEIAKVYLRTGKYKEAIGHFEIVTQLDETYRFVFTNLADAYLKAGFIEKAEAAYKKAIAIKPKNENAYINLGVHYGKAGKAEEGINLLKEAIEVNPRSATAYNNLALLLIKEKQWPEALRTLAQAVQKTGLEKFRASLLKLLKHSRLLVKDAMQKKDYTAAEELLNASLTVLPEDAVALTNLGMVLHVQKKYGQEKEVLARLVQLEGPLARNAYANLAKLQEQSGDLNAAIKTIKQALKTKKESYFEQELARLTNNQS